MIRKAMLSDIDALKAIADANKPSIGFVMRATLQESIAHDWLLVAESNGVVVGFANYRHCQRLSHTTLYEICVSESHRGQGHGHALIDAMWAESQEQGKQCIRLKTPVDLPANTFYAALGFEHIGTEQGKKRPLNVWVMAVGRGLWQIGA